MEAEGAKMKASQYSSLVALEYQAEHSQKDLYLKHNRHLVLLGCNDGHVELDLPHGDGFVNDNVAYPRPFYEKGHRSPTQVRSFDLHSHITNCQDAF